MEALKLLPVEPDEAMIEAGEEEIASRRSLGCAIYASDIYEAMVGAYEPTPDPQPAAQPGVVKALEWNPYRALNPFGQYSVTDGPMQHGKFGCWFNGAVVGLDFGSVEEAKAAAQADYERRILSQIDFAALAAPVSQEPVDAERIAKVIAEESANGAACGWKACSGCHETNEGYETGDYPYSEIFGCHVGSGCGECGGIGVVWEYWGKVSLDAMAEDVATPPSPEPDAELVEALDAIRKKAILYANGKNPGYEEIQGIAVDALNARHRKQGGE